MAGFHPVEGVGGSFPPKTPSFPPKRKERKKKSGKGEREREGERGKGRKRGRREHIFFGAAISNSAVTLFFRALDKYSQTHNSDKGGTRCVKLPHTSPPKVFFSG
jgi:hypothetical protein